MAKANWAVVQVVKVNIPVHKHRQVMVVHLVWVQVNHLLTTVIAVVVEAVAGMVVELVNQILPPIILTTQMEVLGLSIRPPMLHQDLADILDYNSIVELPRTALHPLNPQAEVRRQVIVVMDMQE